MATTNLFDVSDINFFDSTTIASAMDVLFDGAGQSIKDKALIYNSLVYKWIQDYDNLVANYNIIRARNYESALLEGAVNYNKEGRASSIAKSWSLAHASFQEEYNVMRKQMTQVLISGYYLWDKLRENFTGQSIRFNILYSSSENKEKVLHEADISIEELLQRGSFNLTRDIKSGTFGVSLDRLRQNENTEYERLDEIHTRFYRQLEENFLNLKHNINRGTIYEVYKQISNFERFPVVRGVTDKWFKNNKDMVNRKIHQSLVDNSSGRKIGDYGKAQLKNIENASAQISAIGTLRVDFNNYLKYFNDGNSKEILKLFVIDKFQKGGHIDKITRNANNEAKAELNKRLNEILSGIT